MKKPFKYISLQNMSPAFIMKAGDDSGFYLAHRPRAPDARDLTKRESWDLKLVK